MLLLNIDGINTNENSNRFDHTWKNVYSSDIKLPWYLLAGNHDHYGNVTAEIEYSHKFLSDSANSWNFPSLYYKKNFKSASNDISLDVIFIDTVDLSGNTVGNEDSNPQYYDALPYRTKSAAAEQWNWIETQLSESTADYLLFTIYWSLVIFLFILFVNMEILRI